MKIKPNTKQRRKEGDSAKPLESRRADKTIMRDRNISHRADTGKGGTTECAHHIPDRVRPGKMPALSMKALLVKILNEDHEFEQATNAEIVCRSLVKTAQFGDQKAITTIFERIDGKVAEKLELATPEEMARGALEMMKEMDSTTAGEKVDE